MKTETGTEEERDDDCETKRIWAAKRRGKQYRTREKTDESYCDGGGE